LIWSIKCTVNQITINVDEKLFHPFWFYSAIDMSMAQVRQGVMRQWAKLLNCRLLARVFDAWFISNRFKRSYYQHAI